MRIRSIPKIPLLVGLAVASVAALRAGAAGKRSAPRGSAAAPEIFGRGVFSTADEDDSITFTPDGRSAYFVKRCPGTVGSPLPIICESHQRGGRWSTPAVAFFSGRYRDGSPFITPDGARLYFASARPVDGKPRRDYDIWYLERSESGWSEPRHLGEPINTEAQEFAPSTTADGTMYFTSSRPGGPGPLGIYRSRLVGGAYQAPELLGGGVNTENGEFGSCVSADERFLIFVSAGRADEVVGVHARYDAGDLYISYRSAGGWTPARNLGRPINSGARESSPRLSPDGKDLYFTSERGFATYRADHVRTYAEIVRANHGIENSFGNIYRVSMEEVLARTKPST